MARLPIALTLFRLVAGAAFLPLVLWHASAWLLVALLIAGLLSDIADGIIARRLGVATLALRRLDTRADMVFYGCAVAAALVCASFPLAHLWPWLAAYGLLFVVRNLVDYLRYRASPSYHMWSGKLWSVVLFAHLVALFCGAQAFFLLPFAFACYAINAAEGIVASLVLPQPCTDVPTVWHAFTLTPAPNHALQRTGRAVRFSPHSALALALPVAELGSVRPCHMHQFAEVYCREFGLGCIQPLGEEFCTHFGLGSGLYGCNCRPHINGWGYNAVRDYQIPSTREGDIKEVWNYVHQMAAWLLDRRMNFGAEDEFSFIVTWPEQVQQAGRTSRHILRTGGDFATLGRILATMDVAAYTAQLGFRVLSYGWDDGLYNNAHA